MTWAQVVSGVVLNPVTVHPSQCFNAEWLETAEAFIEVPDGTKHGATDNGDGTYTNPPEPEPESDGES